MDSRDSTRSSLISSTSGAQRVEILQPRDVVGSHGQGERLVDLDQPSDHHSSRSTDHLRPSEALLDALPFALTDLVANVSRGPAIDGAVCLYEPLGVVGLVRSDGDVLFAHRIRGHEAQEVEVSAEGLMLLKGYDKLQEEEADWLSGCLLLPRDALLAIKKRRLDDAAAAVEYGVSMRMLSYRMAMTGVKRQFA